jgi:hypothetical protein
LLDVNLLKGFFIAHSLLRGEGKGEGKKEVRSEEKVFLQMT